MAKSKTVSKIVAGALALAVAAGTICCIGYASRDNSGKWFGNSDLGSWHWADDKLDGGNEGGGPVISDGEANGMVMSATAIPLDSYEEYGVSALAENAYSLSVTYTPSDTTYKKTNFTVAFKNPSSTWATGKTVTDYVTVTATGDTTATLTVLKHFSEQIIVTATNNRNSAVKATTTVDYVGAWNAGIDSTTLYDLQEDIEVTVSGLYYGTLSPNYSNCITITFDFYSSYVNAMTAKGYTMSSSVEYTFTPDEVGSSISLASLENILMKAGGFTHNYPTTAEEKAYWQALSSAFLGGGKPEDMSGQDICSYSITSHRVYNGTTYTSESLSDEEVIYLTNWGLFEVVATSMSTNSPSIIAG